jgi:hypothetical protein
VANAWHVFLDDKKISSAAWHVGDDPLSGLWVNSPLFLDKILGENTSYWTDPKNMTENGRYLYRLFTGNGDTTTNGQKFVVPWPEFDGETQVIPTSGYYGWADVVYDVQQITNGGKVILSTNGTYAGLGTWIGDKSIGQEKCQHGISYSYLGAAHRFDITLLGDIQLTSGRRLEKTTAWKTVEHRWTYFEDFSGTLSSLVWKIPANTANRNKDSLQVKDVLCLDPAPLPSSSSTTPSSSSGGGSSSSSDDGTPIRLPQVANGPLFVYASGNDIVLQNLPSNAKIGVYNLQGKQVYLGNSGNSQTLQIAVRTKGMYIVKAGTEKFRIVVR